MEYFEDRSFPPKWAGFPVRIFSFFIAPFALVLKDGDAGSNPVKSEPNAEIGQKEAFFRGFKLNIFLCELNKCIHLFIRGAVVDGNFCQTDAVMEIVSLCGCNQRCGCIQQYNISFWTFFAL